MCLLCVTSWVKVSSQQFLFCICFHRKLFCCMYVCMLTLYFEFCLIETSWTSLQFWVGIHTAWFFHKRCLCPVCRKQQRSPIVGSLLHSSLQHHLPSLFEYPPRQLMSTFLVCCCFQWKIVLFLFSKKILFLFSVKNCQILPSDRPKPFTFIIRGLQVTFFWIYSGDLISELVRFSNGRK